MNVLDWFEKLFGFKEESPKQVKSNLILGDGFIASKVNGKEYKYGRLDILTLSELRNNVRKENLKEKRCKISEEIGDVQYFHQLSENEGALFQAASQFNLLEMVNPNVSPEQGIGKYEYDLTQGPACAIACGAGTVYRNYFVEINGKEGQTSDNQIDCLDIIGDFFNNAELKLWEMKNGYALANQPGLKFISKRIANLNPQEYEDLKGKLKVGIQWDAEVTINSNGRKVSQIYCSALPVAYSMTSHVYWEDFSKLILEATYEASLIAGIINSQRTNNNRLYLTLVGGGAFGNKEQWIVESVLKSVKRYENTGLDIRFVSYSTPSKAVKNIIEDFNKIS
ncbi:MAG: hypothetical protein AAFX46_12890 [Cyanobacteria bacterium J06636_27]